MANVASPREVRAFLLERDDLPENVTVGTRGRLSQAAKDHFTSLTGQQVAEVERRETVAAE